MMESTKKVCTVSDLHLFCRRSQAERHMPFIESAASEADVFVLNGDTFDFRWSCYGDAAETTRHALRRLERLTTQSPQCHFHFILGNHDHVQVFMDSLHDFAERTPNLSWHPYYLKLGTTLFLHGDVANRNMNAADLEAYRREWLEEEGRGEFVNTIYDMAFRAKVHCAVTRLVFPTHTVIERLRYYLDDIGEGADSQTQTVYFGHTHAAINGLDYQGQRFYNCGAPMPGMDFNLLRTSVAA